MSINLSVTEDKEDRVEVKGGKGKKAKVPFLKHVRLGFLGCLPIYSDLAPAESCAGLHLLGLGYTVSYSSSHVCIISHVQEVCVL